MTAPIATVEASRVFPAITPFVPLDRTCWPLSAAGGQTADRRVGLARAPIRGGCGLTLCESTVHESREKGQPEF